MDELSSTCVSQQMADSPDVPEMKMSSLTEHRDVFLHGDVLVEYYTQVSAGLRGIDGRLANGKVYPYHYNLVRSCLLNTTS